MDIALQRKRYKVITIFAFCIFGLINSEFSIIAVLPYISEAFSISQSQAGYLLSVFSFLVCVLGPITVAFFAHYSPKKLIIFTLSTLILANIIAINSSSYFGILFSRILPAFIHTLMWSVFFTWAPLFFDVQEKSKAVSLINIGSVSAIVIGMPLSYMLTVIFNWKACFYLSIAMDTFALLLVIFFLPNLPRRPKQTFFEHFSILKNKSIVFAMLSGTGIFTAMYCMYTYWTLYLQTISQFSHSQISIILFLFGFMGYIGNYTLGRITVPANNTKIFMIILCILLCVYLSIYFTALSFPFILLLACVWGGFQNSIGTVLQPFVTKHTGQFVQFANSLFISTINLGIALGSFVGGFTQKNFSVHFNPMTSIIFIVITMVCIGLSLQLRKKA